MHEITWGKYEIAILNIKLVTKQITYCGEITTEQVSEAGKKRVSRKTTG